MRKDTRHGIKVSAKVVTVLGLMGIIMVIVTWTHSLKASLTILAISVIVLAVSGVLHLMACPNGQDTDDDSPDVSLEESEGIIKTSTIDINNYRDLTSEDTIQEGDVYFNPKWEVSGPWFRVLAGDHGIGLNYVPGEMRHAKRLIEK